jgi:CRP-like cAMP-binding protein
MENDLLKFLSKYGTFTEEEIRIIQDQKIIREYRKDSILLREGQIAKECFLVLKGCVRNYYLLDGEERTTDFFTEYEPVIPVSYTKNEPSEYFITCMEDCILSVGSTESTEKFLTDWPKFAPLFAKISNDILANNQISFDSYKNLSPEKRYQKLLELKPGLIQRVPQYYLASYLGIKPQSLSRIRKRLAENNKRTANRFS